MALSLQLNVYFDSLKHGDMLYIRKYILIRECENSLILLNKRKIYNSTTKIFPIAK
jgi:hypothetical protein